jgi:hypothetical protein
MGGPAAAGDLRTGYLMQAWLAVSTDTAATVSGGYWYHRQQRAPAAQAGIFSRGWLPARSGREEPLTWHGGGTPL